MTSPPHSKFPEFKNIIVFVSTRMTTTTGVIIIRTPLRIFGIRIFSLRLLFYFFLSKIFLAFIILLFPDQIWATRSLNFRQNLRFRLENTLKNFSLRRADRPCVYYSTFFCPKIFLRLLFYFFLSKISSCVYYSTFKGVLIIITPVLRGTPVLVPSAHHKRSPEGGLGDDTASCLRLAQNGRNC